MKSFTEKYKKDKKCHSLTDNFYSKSPDPVDYLKMADEKIEELENENKSLNERISNLCYMLDMN